MFGQIFSFELKLWFKRPGVYIFFLLFFALATLVTSQQAGLIGNSTGDSNAITNSARAVGLFLLRFNTGFIALIVLVSIVGPVVSKDYQYNTHPLLFTKPISKFGYLIGRFSAVFCITLLVMSGGMFGHMFVCALPGIDPAKLGPFSLMNYLQPFIYFVVPNTLLGHAGQQLDQLVLFFRRHSENVDQGERRAAFGNCGHPFSSLFGRILAAFPGHDISQMPRQRMRA